MVVCADMKLNCKQLDLCFKWIVGYRSEWRSAGAIGRRPCITIPWPRDHRPRTNTWLPETLTTNS